MSVADHCFRSRDHVNVLVVDKQAHPQFLTLEQAHAHWKAGASIWEWAGTENPTAVGAEEEPDIVLASAGDVPTEEILAAAHLLREWARGCRVRRPTWSI